MSHDCRPPTPRQMDRIFQRDFRVRRRRNAAGVWLIRENQYCRVDDFTAELWKRYDGVTPLRGIAPHMQLPGDRTPSDVEAVVDDASELLWLTGYLVLVGFEPANSTAGEAAWEQLSCVPSASAQRDTCLNPRSRLAPAQAQ